MIGSMIEFIYALVGTNVLSLALATYYWRKSKITQARPESIELQEFLMDLATGGSFLHVKRLPPGDMVMRRRR